MRRVNRQRGPWQARRHIPDWAVERVVACRTSWWIDATSRDEFHQRRAARATAMRWSRFAKVETRDIA